MRLALTILALAAAASPALAQQETVFALSPHDRFVATDANKDGKVTKDELAGVLNADARPYVQAIFDNRDKNKDGWLDEDELSANNARRFGPPRPPQQTAANAPAPKGE